MRELREWLHWATNETQVPALERAKRAPSDETCTLSNAASLLTERARGEDFDYSHDDIAWCLTNHPDALRDLCLAFADAIEKMREQVEPAPPPAVVEAPRVSAFWRTEQGQAQLPGEPIAAQIYRSIREHNELLAARRPKVYDYALLYESQPLSPIADAMANGSGVPLCGHRHDTIHAACMLSRGHHDAHLYAPACGLHPMNLVCSECATGRCAPNELKQR